MALESKPLFHPEVIRQHVRAFSLPAHVAALQPKLDRWADLIASGQADDLKETALLPDFLTDFFCGLLGYTRPTDGGGSFTLSREQHVEDDGQFADAVLGRSRRTASSSSSRWKARARATRSTARLPGARYPPSIRPTATPSTCRATGSSSHRCARRGCITRARTSTPSSGLKPSDWRRNLKAV